MVSALAAGGRPEAGTVLAAALSVGGGLLLAAQRGTAPPAAGRDGGERARAGRSLPGGGLLVLLGLNLAIGVCFGAVQVSVTAFTVEHDAPGAAAAVFAASSGSGLLAGWLYGLRRWYAPAPVQLLAVTGVLTAGTLLLFAAGSPWGLGLAVLVTGGAVPPLLALFTVLTESAVPARVLTRAFAWLGSASAAGSAAAASLTGWAVDAHGARGGFALASTAAAAMALQSLAGLRVLGAPRVGT